MARRYSKLYHYGCISSGLVAGMATKHDLQRRGYSLRFTQDRFAQKAAYDSSR
jgi:hypothetical protein